MMVCLTIGLAAVSQRWWMRPRKPEEVFPLSGVVSGGEALTFPGESHSARPPGQPRTLLTAAPAHSQGAHSLGRVGPGDTSPE